MKTIIDFDDSNRHLQDAKFYNKKTAVAKEEIILCSMVDYTDTRTHMVKQDGKNVIQSTGILLLDILMYHYNTGTRFDIYTGVKDANAQVNQLPIDNQSIKQVKEFYLSIGKKSYNSGELPIPSTLGNYEWMAYVDFCDNHTRFTVKPKHECNIRNPRQEALYAEAEKQYFVKHYKGSIEEANKNRLEYCIQQSKFLRAQADLKFLLGLDPSSISFGIVTLRSNACSIDPNKFFSVTEIVLHIRSFSSLLEIVQYNLFPYFVDGISKYGTPLRIEQTYELNRNDNSYFIGQETEDNEKDDFIAGYNETLSSCLSQIDNNPTIKNDPESLKVIMYHLMDEFKYNTD